MAFREVACTKYCHLQHFAALRRPSATCIRTSCRRLHEMRYTQRLHEMQLYAMLGRPASPRRYATCNGMLCNRAFRTRAPSHKHTHPLAPSPSTYCRATTCNHEEEFSNPTPSMNTFHEKRAYGSNNAHYLLCYVMWLGHGGLAVSINSHERFYRAKTVDHERRTVAKE